MNPSHEPKDRTPVVERILLLWIALTALFFYLRFSATFYYANARAIHDLATTLGF